MKLNLNPVPVPAPVKNSGPDYDNPLGLWHVTTEGDEEGRKTIDLGFHYGHLAEIAFSLADKCGWSLRFRKESDAVEERPMYTATRDTVSVMMDIKSNTWGRPANSLVEYFHRILDTGDVLVLRSDIYSSVTLKLTLKN